MKCSDVHLAIGAEPRGMSPELEEHLRACAPCAQYRREMLELEDRIQRALQIDLAALKSDAPARPAVRIVSSTAPPPTRSSWLGRVGQQWALAASMLFAVAVVLVLWGAPRHSLAADVVAHVISEPLPWAQDSVPQAALNAVLKNSNQRLDPIRQEVLFAQTCFFRGRLVPHFVVRSGNAEVTVLVLPNESVKTTERFSESGYSGILVPNADRGSIAVLSRSPLDSENEAREILNALHAQPSA